jgi:broad specificity phosphatase PhoE
VIIYLSRHASPDLTRTDLVYHLPPGPPLTPRGQAEAQSLGTFLKQVKISRIYSSPLERCLATAHIVSEITGAPVEVLKQLTELQPGEDNDSLYSRLWPVFERAANELSDGRPAVLITHGGPVAFLLAALGMDEVTLNQNLTFDHRNPLPPAGAWEISRANESQPWILRLAFIPEPIL